MSLFENGTNCRILEFGTNCRLGRIVAWDELSLGTNCRLGRIVARDELSLGVNCHPTDGENKINSATPSSQTFVTFSKSLKSELQADHYHQSVVDMVSWVPTKSIGKRHRIRKAELVIRLPHTLNVRSFGEICFDFRKVLFFEFFASFHFVGCSRAQKVCRCLTSSGRKVAHCSVGMLFRYTFRWE